MPTTLDPLQRSLQRSRPRPRRGSKLGSRLLTVLLLSTVVIAASVRAAAPAEAQAATTTTPPGVPAGFQTSPVQFLTATRQGDFEVKVSWVPPQTALSPILRYRVGVVSDSAIALPNPALIVVNSGVTSVNFKGLKAGHTYFFQVQPETTVGAGAVSELTAPIAITDGSERKPFPVTGVSVTVLTPPQAAVVWTPPAPRPNVTINKYRITTFPSSKTVDVPAQVNSALLTALKVGVTYYVQVQAVSNDGKYSDPAISNPVLIPFPIAATIAPTAPPTPAPTTSTTTTTLALPLPSPVAVPALASASRCTSRVWNPSLLGVPSKLQAGAPSGIYIWTDGRTVHLRTYNNSTTPVRFSGSVSANTSMPTARFYLEPDSDSVSVGRSAVSFSFASAYDIDALRFDGRCVRSLTFRLYLNGAPINPSQVFLGANNVNPSTSAFVITR